MAKGDAIYFPDVQSDIDMKNTYKLLNYPGSGNAILSVNKTIYVDGVNGTSGGVRGTSSAFQTIAQALAVVQNGDSIIVRPGTYATAPFSITGSNIKLFLEGAVLQAAATTASPMITVTGSNIWIVGGEFDGLRGGAAIGNGGAITVNGGASGVSISNNYIHGYPATALTIGQCNGLNIIGNKFNDNFNCILGDTDNNAAHGYYNVTISDNRFTGGFSVADQTGAIKLHVNVAYSAGSIVSNNTIISAGQQGIECNVGADGTVISGNYIYGTTFGISIGACANSIICGNYIKGTTIGMEASGTVTHTLYSDNIVDARDSTGAVVGTFGFSGSAFSGTGPDTISIRGNKFLYGSTFVVAFSSVTNSEIVGNEIIGSGFLTQIAGNNTRIFGNDFLLTANGTFVYMDATSAALDSITIQSNRFTTSSGHITAGIGVEMHTPGIHNITNVSIINNWTDGSIIDAFWFSQGGGVGVTPTYRLKGNFTSYTDPTNVSHSFGSDTVSGLNYGAYFPLGDVTGDVGNLNVKWLRIGPDNTEGFGAGYSVTDGKAYLQSIKPGIGWKDLDLEAGNITLTTHSGTAKVGSNVIETQNNKGQISGYASLDGTGKVPAAQLPTLSSGTIAVTSDNLKGDGAGNAVAVTATGTGDTVLATSPTLVTPTIGVATATSVNKWTLTAPSTAATLTAGADGLTYTLPEITTKIGFRHIPQNSQSAPYTTVLNDSGKHLYHPAADANNRTFTIDSNANVAYPIGTAIMFVNLSANNLSIAITADTMYLAGTGTTGTRTLAQYGKATAVKTGTTEWVISGVGLS